MRRKEGRKKGKVNRKRGSIRTGGDEMNASYFHGIDKLLFDTCITITV